MSEETNTAAPEVETTEEAAAPEKIEPIMCFVSKKMVPSNETVEVEYSPGKKYSVSKRFLR